ncbi:MAG: hypothetical protein NUW37_11870 [Planctomycetes bacterium]|nr:hypothetical protein [Planctomycetota bacterium]
MIFVSYNPNSKLEQSTAFRLQTLAALYGAEVRLPDRFGEPWLKDSTKSRIDESDYYLLFSDGVLSSAVVAELDYAASRGIPVHVFYTRKVKYKKIDGVNQWYFDPYSANLGEAIDKVVSEPPRSRRQIRADGALRAMVGIGLGMFALWLYTHNAKK